MNVLNIVKNYTKRKEAVQEPARLEPLNCNTLLPYQTLNLAG